MRRTSSTTRAESSGTDEATGSDRPMTGSHVRDLDP